jgi:hypothetical protein
MAGRIRTLKPEILENERTASLEHDTWRLFVSMILLADDYGNLQGHPDRLAGAVFWAKGSRDIREMLAELSRAELILVYRHKARQCVHILGWSEHQRVDKPGHPRVPGPAQADDEPAREPFATASRESREGLAPDLDPDPDPDPDPEETVAPASLPRPAGHLFPVEPAVASDMPAKPTPLPFKPDEALRAIAAASHGRFIASKLNRGQSINAQRLIRAHPDLAEWQLVGEWLGAGGGAWRSELDARSVGSFEAWLAHAAKWRDDGRPPIDRRGARASPTNADPKRGQAPVPRGLDYSAGGSQ